MSLLGLLVSSALLAGPVAVAPGVVQPVTQVQAGTDQSYGCLACHADKRRSFSRGVHSERDIRCHDCHGGDPAAIETAPAHRGMKFDSGNKVEIAELCSSCHSDPNLMRRYGLPAGEMLEFRTSRHGQFLFRGNTDAPTCTDCHDAHTILRRTDARSNIHPTNIPATCNRCHEDAAMMQKYGLPTDQYSAYRSGAHGIAVFEDGNFAAPTCVGCHGSHSALPPATTEISTVCDRCHVLLGVEFHAGPHGAASRGGRIPGCLACHANHGTEVAAPDSIAAMCTTCHAADSRASLVGAEIQTLVMRARDELALADGAIRELSRSGRRVSDARFLYEAALTSYAEMAKAQHSLDVEMLDDLGRRVGSISREIRGSAEASREHKWEHRLLLGPIWFLALAALVLVGFTLARLDREP